MMGIYVEIDEFLLPTETGRDLNPDERRTVADRYRRRVLKPACRKADEQWFRAQWEELRAREGDDGYYSVALGRGKAVPRHGV